MMNTFNHDSGDTNSLSKAWVFGRVLFLICILIMIMWASLGANDQSNVRFEMQKKASTVRSGGQSRWEKEVGERRALEMMRKAAHFMQSELYKSPQSHRRRVTKAVLSVEEGRMSLPAITIEKTVHISSKHIENFEGDAASEMEALIFKAMASLWIWDGEGEAPLELLDAMAEYLRAASTGLQDISANQGACICQNGLNRHGAVVYSAHFLQFCEATKPGFVSELNARLATGWNESFFQDFMGHSLETLLESYQIWQVSGLLSLSCNNS